MHSLAERKKRSVQKKKRAKFFTRSESFLLYWIYPPSDVRTWNSAHTPTEHIKWKCSRGLGETRKMTFSATRLWSEREMRNPNLMTEENLHCCWREEEIHSQRECVSRMWTYCQRGVRKFVLPRPTSRPSILVEQKQDSQRFLNRAATKMQRKHNVYLSANTHPEPLRFHHHLL